MLTAWEEQPSNWAQPPSPNKLDTPLKWTPQDTASFNRTCWNDRIYTGDHYTKSRIVNGQPKAILHHSELDRDLHHTKGDFHGKCASQLRANENFEQMCSERLGRSEPLQLTMKQRAQAAERQRAAEAKVRERLRDRVARRLAAERMMLPVPPPGSRAAQKLRKERDAMRPSSQQQGDAAYERWQRQFAGGRAHTERLTGHYVPSLGDVERIERTPAERKMPGSSRLTTVKMMDYFSSSLRDYASPRPSSSSSAVASANRSAATPRTRTSSPQSVSI